MDNSFIKLHNSIAEALSLGDLKNTQISYYTSIQLLPNEGYLQKTNIDGGISFQGDYKVEIIDQCNTVHADITSNVFINEYIDSRGQNQCDIEYVNLTVDFGGRAVILKFTHTISDVVYYSNPIKITSKQSYKTIRFDYRHFEELDGVSYQNSPLIQSIRLNCEYSSPKDNSEVGEYYQISQRNTISTRFLEKTSHDYICNEIDLFAYNRLKKLFKHSYIYIDSEMVTNNPLLKEDGRKGMSNLFSANFNLYKNEDEIYTYDYQIFEGLIINSEFTPQGAYTLSILPDIISMTFNTDVVLGEGTIKIYNSSDVLIHTYTENNLTVLGNVLSGTGLQTYITVNSDYHVKVSQGIVNYIGVPYDGIDDDTTWVFRVTDGQYNKLQFNNSQFITD